MTPTGHYECSEGTVRYAVEGNGPDVVMVHGTPWSSFSWSLLAPQLTPHYRVHRYDLIGYGSSDKQDNQRVSLDVQSDLLGELINHWRLTEPAIIAHDFGGAISLRTHLLGGIDFSALLLMNVVAIAPWGSPFFAHVRKHEAAFSGVPAYIHEAIVERYVRGALYNEPDKQTLRKLVQPWLDKPGQKAFYRQIAQADQRYTDEVEPHYAQMRCPVRILWGVEDGWIPLATGERLHRLMPGSTFVPIDNAGHLCQLENAHAVGISALDFLGDSSA